MWVLRRCAVASLFVLGCGAASPGAAGAPSSSADETEEVRVPGDPVLTLVEPGEEPRTPLRYLYTAGRRTSLSFEMETSMSMKIGELPAKEIDTPPIRMTLGIEVLDVDASTGTARVRNTVDRAEVVARARDPQALVEAVAGTMHSLVGMRSDVSITTRGFARDMKTNLPENVDPKLRSILEDSQSMTQQACASFPKEAVGLGAHWRVESKVKASNFELEQTALVTLVERNDDRVVLSFTLDQTAPKQPLRSPDLAPGTRATLESYVAHGNGRWETPLDGGAARGELLIRSSFVTLVAVESQEVKVSNEMQMTMAMSPIESEAKGTGTH